MSRSKRLIRVAPLLRPSYAVESSRKCCGPNKGRVNLIFACLLAVHHFPHRHPSMGLPSCAWRLTISESLSMGQASGVDCWKCQTVAATPAEPGNSHYISEFPARVTVEVPRVGSGNDVSPGRSRACSHGQLGMPPNASHRRVARHPKKEAQCGHG